MNTKDFFELFGKQARTKEMQRFAIGVGIAAIAGIITGVLIAPKSRKKIKDKAISTVEDIGDFVQKKSKTIKDTADDTVQKVSDAIQDMDEKTTGVAKEMKNGYKKIKKDVDQTKQAISQQLHEDIK